MHVIKIYKKEVMNLNQSVKVFIGGLEGQKWKIKI